MTPFSSVRSRTQLAWLAMAFAWLVVLAFVVHGTPIGDEWVHWFQIKRFLEGDYRVFEEWLTNIPGYHWLLTALLSPLGVDGLGWVRTVTALMTAGCVWIFFHIRLRLSPDDAQRSSAQFLFLPTMFVYGFMSYTDIPALLLMLGAFLATLQSKHRLSAGLMVASMAIRQNNVLWLGFLALLAGWPVLQRIVDAPSSSRCEWARWREWVAEIFALIWPYCVAVGCFCLYWAWNGSIAYSTAQSENAHPDFRLDIGNPIFMLALAGVLFPLQLMMGWRRLIAFGLRWKGAWIWLVPLVVFGVYALLFKVHHPFNFIVNANVRNQWLQFVAEGGWAWWAFGGVATWAFCGLLFQRYALPQGWIWLPFSLLFIGASWMIETRYTIVPFVLFLALRKPEGVWAERVTLTAWIALSAWLSWQVFNHHFML